MSLNYFTICDLIVTVSQVFLPPAVSPLGLPDLTREICALSLFCRAPSSASAKTATPGFFVRNMTPATTDLVATTAPALTSGRGVKDATSRAPVNQVCVLNLFSFQSVRYCCSCSACCGIISYRVLLRRVKKPELGGVAVDYITLLPAWRRMLVLVIFTHWVVLFSFTFFTKTDFVRLRKDCVLG